jgi:O-antigen ligase
MGMMAISISINPSQSNTFFTDKGRLAGAALNPIAIGQYGASLFLLSLLILLRRKSLGNRFQRRIWTIIYSIGTLIGMIVTLLAASRGPIVGWAITSLLIIFSFRRIGMRWIFTLIFIAISLVNAASFAVYQGSSVMDRILLIDDEFDPTSQGRRFLIDATVKVISDNFIFGVGIEAPGLGYPHNLVLESFLPFGLIGGIGFICIFIQAWVKSIVLLLDKNQEWDWLGVLFIQYSIISFSSGSLYASYTFWYLLFAVLGIDTQFHLDEELLRRKLD